MTKFDHQSPRHGVSCKFILKDGTILTGHYEMMSASVDEGVIIYEKHHANLSKKDFNKIDSWEYTK